MTAEFTTEAMNIMWQRCGWACEVQWPNVCQTRDELTFALQAHHRRPRGMGGTKRRASRLAGNGLMTCPWCHNFLETGERGQARKLGFIVPQNADPCKVKVFYRHERNVLLDNDGNVVAA